MKKIALQAIALLASTAPVFAQGDDLQIDLPLDDLSMTGSMVPPPLGIAGLEPGPDYLEGFVVAVNPDEAPGPIEGGPPGPPPEAGGPPGPRGHFRAAHRHFSHFRKGPFAALEGDLALTDEQMEKLYAIKNSHLNKISPKMADLGVLRREMQDAMTRPDVDRSKVLDLQNRINSQRAAIANLGIEEKLDAMQVLTADQRKALRHKMVERGFGCRRGGKHCP